jgi:hypothetical protein
MTAYATDDTITVPIPADLAAGFAGEESFRPPGKRELFSLRLLGDQGDHDLGMWRIDGIASQMNDGVPRMVATLRRVLP